MTHIHAFIEFLITAFLRCAANTRSVLNRVPLWCWLNKPISESCAPVVRWWNAKAELASSDRNRYFMSARRRYGIFGYGLYTQYQPIVLTDEYNTEIEELMKFRYKHESSFFMGGRFEVMAYIKGLRNSDFDNAITMDEFRAARFTAYIDAFCADSMNHQSLFRHWLSVQVKRGAIVSIDGYIFTGIEKNCEIGAFLYKYFDTFETAHAVGLHQGYRSPEHLAQYLIKELQKAALGLRDDFVFDPINATLRDYTERNKASMIPVTDLGNDATLSEKVEAMVQAHIADKARNPIRKQDMLTLAPFETEFETVRIITFTTKTVIELESAFNFTDVLGISLNGEEVDISKSISIAESLKAAGITFTDNARYLHYTPANKYVESAVLRLNKTADIKSTMAFAGSINKDELVNRDPDPATLYPATDLGELITKQNIIMDLTPEIRSMSGMDKLIEEHTFESTDIVEMASKVSKANGRLNPSSLSRG